MKKSVGFCFAILTLATMLFVSCAGGTSSADGDVGYLTFGSSRAEFAGNSGGGQGASNGIRLSDIYCTAADLTSLTLKGTRNGKTTTLYTWSTYGEISGTAVPVQAGSWTFVLSGEATPATGATGSLLFTSEQDAVITAGEDTSVTFTMIYNGVPASEAQTGDIILTNGRAINPAAAAFFANSGYSADFVAVRTSNGTVYGIYKNFSTGGNYTSVSGEAEGYGCILPSISTMRSIETNLSVIQSAYSNLNSSMNWTADFWTSNSALGGTKHYLYNPVNHSYGEFLNETSSDSNPDVSTAAIYVKQF